MRKTLTVLAATVAFIGLSTQADARHSRHYHHASAHHIMYGEEHVVAHPSGCPGRAFCGCGVCVKVFGHPCVRGGLAQAAEWARRFPRAIAAAGMVAVFGRHHVAYIERLDANGNAVLYDPNSGGHLTRIHTRSLAGATIVNPRG